MKKAQVSFEFLIAAILSMVLLLLGVAVFIDQGTQSKMWISADTNSIECNKIADAITDVYISKGEMDKNLAVFANTDINRLLEGAGLAKSAGQIVIGAFYCNYFGNATLNIQPNTNPKTQIPANLWKDTERNGFSLAIAKYRMTKVGDAVVFTKWQ